MDSKDFRRRRRFSVDSKPLYLEIDVSSGANSFEIEKLRLSTFQNDVFRRNSISKRSQNVDFESS